MAAEAAALLHKAHEIGLGGYLLGTQQGGTVGIGLAAQHGLQRTAHVIGIVEHGEHGHLLHGAGKLGVYHIRTDHPLALTHRHDVNALSRIESYPPVVDRYSGDDIVRAERPSGSHMAVFDPQVTVVFRYLYVHT